MMMNDMTYQLFRPDLENPGPDDFAPFSQMMHTLPVPWVDADRHQQRRPVPRL